MSEIKDQEGFSEYFYYDNEGNLTKHIDRNQNHVDRKYNADRNIVDLKAYTIDEEAVALDEKKALEEKERAKEEAKMDAEERFKNSALTEAPRRRSFTERIKEKKEKQELEEQSPKIEKVEDPDRHKLNIVNQRFNYNPDGTLKNAYTGNMQYEYDYNIEGMLESKSASGKMLLKYTYDKNNNIKTIKDITGKSSVYSYDETNKVKEIKDYNQNTLAAYDYYKNDNIKTITVGNGLKTDYTYDGDGNVQSLVTISSTGEVLVDYNYAYDLNGNRLQKVSSKHKNYYTYDSMNRVKDSSYDDRCESFTYDKVGNRLTKTTNDITEKYVYNVKNQLQELHNKNGINYFTHDKQGNTIKEETNDGNNIFEYNTLNQQVKAITKDGNTLVSRYDTEGLRAEIEENEKLTKFIFHKDNILVEADKEYNSISRFTRGYEVVAADIADLDGDLNSEIESKLCRHYYTVDEQGSTIFITDKNQQVKNEYCYDAFGCVLEAQEEVHNRITYAGQQYDGITGQYYLRARFYNPVIGRFTQEDTYRGDGLNLYAYCGNNPVGYWDPSGYSSLNKESAFDINNYNNKSSNPYDILKERGIPTSFDDVDRKFFDDNNWRMKYEDGKLSDPLPNDLQRNLNIVYEYDEIALGRGTPNLDDVTGIQKVIEDRSNVPKKWIGAKEWDILKRNKDGSLYNGREIETKERIVTLEDNQGNIIKAGYVINHDYTKIKTFPRPWFPDGGKVTK